MPSSWLRSASTLRTSSSNGWSSTSSTRSGTCHCACPSVASSLAGSGRSNFVCARAAQGSRNGPLSWAALASLGLRFVQSLFYRDGNTEPVRIQTCVDDPLIAVFGNPAQRARRMALIVLVWRALGFPLAFHKAARGQRIHWIGCTLSMSTLPTTTIPAEIREEKIEECRMKVAAMSAKNVVTARELRRLWAS